MLIILSPTATQDHLKNIESALSKKGIEYHQGEQEGISQITVLSETTLTPQEVSSWAGVQQVMPLHRPFKLASRERKKSNTEVTLAAGSVIGGQRITLVSSLPLLDRDLDHLEAYLLRLKELGIRTLSLGLKRERTSPYAFSGHGEILLEGLEKLGLPSGNRPDYTGPQHRRSRNMGAFSIGFLVPAEHMANQTLLEGLSTLPQAVFFTRDPGTIWKNGCWPQNSSSSKERIKWSW
jgi:3-deoxy-7-phosphoheptulonate synthase